MIVKVKTNTNIALVKYWGKKNSKLKTPLNNSISMTLDKLFTITSAEVIDSKKDEVFFNNIQKEDDKSKKIVDFIDIFRNNFDKKDKKIRIITENNFPTASGLASSASGFSALSVAVANVLNLNLTDKELSIYSRLGSGSACRSIFGGFVEWNKGEVEDGSDSYATQIKDENYWDLNMIVCIVDDIKKDKSSTDGMKETVETCPFYPAWLETIEKDLQEVRNGILEKDLEKVGQTMEHNCLKMHSTMFTTKPSIIYWKPKTLEIIHKVRELRNEGLNCYFTIDAGANVKILCQKNDSNKIMNFIDNILPKDKIIVCSAGSGYNFI
ncbi:MAG: diphosphomevalonate decarboxylase [Cyanobacteriota bacterium]